MSADTSRRNNMDKQEITAEVLRLASRREFLLQMLEKPDIGTLRIDVNQALEELDELVDEYNQTFPDQVIEA
jgi:hypothetical protein